MQSIQMQLFKKQKSFLNLSSILELRLNFEHFE